MFPRLGYFVPEEPAQLAESVALIGSDLLGRKFVVPSVLMLGSPYITYFWVSLLGIKPPIQPSVTIKV